LLRNKKEEGKLPSFFYFAKKKMKNLFAILLLLSSSLLLQGQDVDYSIWGIKGGTTVGFQTWNNIDQDALFAYNGSLFFESLDDLDAPASLFASIGFSQKGSAKRNIRLFDLNGNILNTNVTRKYVFNNIVLALGAKKRLDQGSKSFTPYYTVGVFGSYTISTELGQAANPGFGAIFDPIDEYVRPVNYGIQLGGGFERRINKYIGLQLDFSAFPELSYQYVEMYGGGNPPLVYNPYTGQQVVLRDRNIRNLAFEITVGLRFLREIIYVD
jgi:hypothetical protein